MISSLRVEINDSEVYHTEREPKELSEGKASLVGDQRRPFLVDRVTLKCLVKSVCLGQRCEVCDKMREEDQKRGV